MCALVVADPVDGERAAAVDLRPRLVHGHVTVLPIDPCYSEYWAVRRDARAPLDLPADVPVIFPHEMVLADLVREVTGLAEPRWAIIQTEYFGGTGDQWAVVFHGATREPGDALSINAALAALGVRAVPPHDEFDTIGLGGYRHNPEYLDRYADLA